MTDISDSVLLVHVVVILVLQELVHRTSEDNNRQRSRKLPLILRIDASGEVYNYGPQALNSADLAKDHLRQLLAKVAVQTSVHVCICQVWYYYLFIIITSIYKVPYLWDQSVHRRVHTLQ